MTSCAKVMKRSGVDARCCESCHEDFEMGYDPHMIELEGDYDRDKFPWLEPGEFLRVCCAVYNELTAPTRPPEDG